MLLEFVRRYCTLDGLRFNRPSVQHTLQGLIGRPPAGRLRLIVLHGKPVGYYCLSYGYSLEWHGRDLFLDEIFIDAPQRHKGLGAQVLHDLVSRARKQGFKAVHLVVRRGNTQALRFYSANGFTRQNVVFMTRRL